MVSVLNQVSDDFRGVGFSLKSGFKKIVLTQELVFVLNRVSQKYSLHQFFLYQHYADQLGSPQELKEGPHSRMYLLGNNIVLV